MTTSNPGRAARARLRRKVAKERKTRRDALAVRWRRLRQDERTSRPTRVLAERRTQLEADTANARSEWLAYRKDARGSLDLAELRYQLKPADDQALQLANWLDAGIDQVAELGGARAAIEEVATRFDIYTRGTSFDPISKSMWSNALSEWPGWAFGRTGRPKAGEDRPRPDVVLLNVLRAAGLKRKTSRIKEDDRADRDAEGLRASVNRARKTRGMPHPKPRSKNV